MATPTEALILIFVLVFVSAVYTKGEKVLLISFDGFRWDYYDHFKSQLSALSKIKENGAHATNGMKSIFPTRSTSIHWSLATGLYHESHGIVDNTFYDPKLDEIYLRTMSDRKWYPKEPIWVTAAKQNKKPGVTHWPGFNIDYGQHSPHIPSHIYNMSTSLRSRINTSLKWLFEDNFELAMIYYHEPDVAGHRKKPFYDPMYDHQENKGPFSLLVEQSMIEINNDLEYLLDRLNEKRFFNNGNLIIVGDHGMAQAALVNASLFLNHFINLEEDLQVKLHSGLNKIVPLWPIKGREKIVLEKLRSKINRDEHHVTVYKNSEIPDRWHYKHCDRIAPIILVADEGYVIQKKDVGKKVNPGQHGYDNEYSSMYTIFFAQGSSFKKQQEISEPFELINIYSMVCKLLSIEENPNNGSASIFQNYLRSES